MIYTCTSTGYLCPSLCSSCSAICHRRAKKAAGGRQAIRKYPCRDCTPKPYHARASCRARWGVRSRTKHRYSRLHGRSLRKSTRFCPNGFPFRCEKWRVRAVVSATTHFWTSDHACDFSRDSRARPHVPPARACLAVRAFSAAAVFSRPFTLFLSASLR